MICPGVVRGPGCLGEGFLVLVCAGVGAGVVNEVYLLCWLKSRESQACMVDGGCGEDGLTSGKRDKEES